MGQRGPKPLPANVLALRRSRHLQQRDSRDTVSPEVEIPGCPKHLMPEARKEWRRVAPLLEELGLVARIDRAALALYCQEYAWWVWHDSLLQRDVQVARERQATHDAAEEAKRVAAEAQGETYVPLPWQGGDGFQVPTPNGSFAYNPHWVARNKASERVDKFLASFGMSPSSRGRVTAGQRNQLPLPGMEPKQGFAAL